MMIICLQMKQLHHGCHGIVHDTAQACLRPSGPQGQSQSLSGSAWTPRRPWVLPPRRPQQRSARLPPAAGPDSPAAGPELLLQRRARAYTLESTVKQGRHSIEALSKVKRKGRSGPRAASQAPLRQGVASLVSDCCLSLSVCLHQSHRVQRLCVRLLSGTVSVSSPVPQSLARFPDAPGSPGRAGQESRPGRPGSLGLVLCHCVPCLHH
jgi:hypothetical protein